MNKKLLFILATISLIDLIFGQSKLQNETVEKNKLKLRFEISLDYSIVELDNKNIFHLKDFQDESKPGDVKLQSNSIFIALPKIENPEIKQTILSKKEIKAIPEFNKDVLLNKDKELIYTDAKVIKNSKNSHFKIMGYLWIGNSFCLHLEVTPAIYFPGKNTIEIISEFEVELTFNNDIHVSNVLNKKFKNSNIISNSNYFIQEKDDRFKIQSDDSWIDYTKQYVKIGTAKDGIYRISKSDLEFLKINTTSINPKTFQLILKGEEIPIFVKGESDLSFDSEDFIEFVGIRNMGGKHRELSSYDKPYNEYLGRYTDTTVYWLTWNSKEGTRVFVSTGNEFSSTDTLDYYTHIDHFEKNLWFDFSCASLVRRETPFWIENKTWIWGGINVGIKNYRFSVSDVYPGKEVNLFLKLQDWVSNITTNAHLLALSLNSGTQLYDSTYVDKYEKVILKADVNSDLLVNGNNTLKVHSFQTNATINTCFDDWYEIEYPRYLKPINDSLNFSFTFLPSKSIQTIQIQNVLTNNLSFWKYGESYEKYSVFNLNNKIILSDTISASDKFCFVDESKIISPKIYYLKQFVNLRSSENKADYIAITHSKFRTKVDEYAKFIEKNYQLSPKVIDIEDIYNEYSYGFFNPEAIKDFLISTHNNWQDSKPQNVALIGGATYDYYGNKFKNFSAITDRVLNYVPSFGASVSDNWFVIWDTTGAYIPQMNIGRIPVKTNEEFDWYFEKHQNYLSQEYDEWNKKYLFFSGGNPTDQSQLDQMKESNQYVIDNFVQPVPIGGKADHFYKTSNPSTNFGPYSQDYIQSSVDEGGVFISYLGHSGTQTWDNSITNPSQLKNNKNRNPIVSDFGCSTGRFAESDVVSFSQLFTVGEDGQALAYVGNSSLGFVSTSLIMPKLFYKKILKENILNVSEAHKEAKLEMLQTYGSTGIYELFSLTNTLIGDPVLSLAIPNKPNFIINSKDIELKTSLLTDLHDSAEVKIKFYNYGNVSSDSLTILVVHEFQTMKDSNFIRILMPSFEDSLLAKVHIKNKAGNHSSTVVIDPKYEYQEISKDENTAKIDFNVASSSIRPMLNYLTVNGINDNLLVMNPTSKPMNEDIVYEISKDKNFSVYDVHEVHFDSLHSNLNLSELNNDNRFWGRLKIKGEQNYSNNFSFLNKRAKYFLSDSLSYEICDLENILGTGGVKIDSSFIRFQLFSAGFLDGNTALIQKDGVNYIPESTIVGHHVALFDSKPPHNFIKYYYFNVYVGGNYITDYIQLIDTLSANYLVAITVADEGTNKVTTELRNQIKSLGSQYIDLVNFRDSWAFIGKKGATPGTMPEAYSKSGDGPVSIDTTISFLSSKGSMLTSEIGPTGKWDKLVVSQEMPSNSSITYTPIGIKSDGVLDTLAQLTLQDSVADLSHINSDIYPKMKILADFTASDDKQSPVLKSLGVDYNDVAELAMNYQVVSVEKDSITQGEKNKLTFFIYNVGETKADSVAVKVELKKPDNSKVILKEFVTSVDSSSKQKFEYDFEIPISSGFGNMAYSITVDEDERITEFFKDNNYYEIPFYVKKDTTVKVNSTEINVRFDGYEIMDGDFVSNNPTLLFDLNYSSTFPTTDTNAVIFTLDNKKISYSKMNVEYDTINKNILYTYTPVLEDGQHYLKVSSGNSAIPNEFGVEKLFEVSNELKAVDIYNYPNPAIDVTNFTFRLSKVPETLDLKVYTVAGRLIKNFELKSYDLKADINKIHWDLTDQDGDKIANGVYLYKIILKAEDKVEHYTQKLAIVR